MSYRRHILRIALAAAVTLAMSSPAHAAEEAEAAAAAAPSPEAKKQASEHFRRGVDLHGEGDYRAALVEFERAYQVAPNYRVLYNLGQTSFQLKDYPAALRAFEGYLAQGGDAIDAKRRQAVEGELAKLRNYVARVELTVDTEDAEVAIDDIVVGSTPLSEPIVVSVGRRKLRITKPGHIPLQRYVDVAGGETKEISFALQPVATQTTTPAPAPQPAPAQDKPRARTESDYTGFWISLGVTAALATGATVMGILALGANSDYEAELDTFPSSAEAIGDARDDVKMFATLTDVFAALAVGSAGVTIMLAITSGGSDDETEEPEEASSSLHLVAGPTSLGLAGSF